MKPLSFCISLIVSVFFVSFHGEASRLSIACLLSSQKVILSPLILTNLKRPVYTSSLDLFSHQPDHPIPKMKVGYPDWHKYSFSNLITRRTRHLNVSLYAETETHIVLKRKKGKHWSTTFYHTPYKPIWDIRSVIYSLGPSLSKLLGVTMASTQSHVSAQTHPLDFDLIILPKREFIHQKLDELDIELQKFGFKKTSVRFYPETSQTSGLNFFIEQIIHKPHSFSFPFGQNDVTSIEGLSSLLHDMVFHLADTIHVPPFILNRAQHAILFYKEVLNLFEKNRFYFNNPNIGKTQPVFQVDGTPNYKAFSLLDLSVLIDNAFNEPLLYYSRLPKPYRGLSFLYPKREELEKLSWGTRYNSFLGVQKGFANRMKALLVMDLHSFSDNTLLIEEITTLAIAFNKKYNFDLHVQLDSLEKASLKRITEIDRAAKNLIQK